MVPKPPKIAIFWYPKATIKLQSRSKAPKRHSKVAAKQHSRKVASQQLSSQAGAKMQRHQDFFPERGILSIFLASPGLQGISKITHFCTQIPRGPDVTITY